MTGIGPVSVRQPRVRDREAATDDSDRIRFSPWIVPPYMRRSKSIEMLLPILYLNGISTGDFSEALAALVGKEGRLARRVRRVAEARPFGQAICLHLRGWHPSRSAPRGREAVHPGADRRDAGRPQGTGRLHRWRPREHARLARSAARSEAARLVSADGALGFWKAAGEVWPTTREQRCWMHKTANVPAKLPKSQQPKAKRALQEIWMAEFKATAERTCDKSYTPKYEKAADCLGKDRDTLLAFYDFTAEHWKHLRTTNPIESTFSTVRHRTIRSTGCLSNKTALTMVTMRLRSLPSRMTVSPKPPLPDRPGSHQNLAIARRETLVPGAVVSEIARRHGLTHNKCSPGAGKHAVAGADG